MKHITICCCIVVCLIACKPNVEYKAYLHNPQLFSNTVHELNSVVMGNNFPPMIAARNYTYAAIAAYEIMAAGYPNQYQSLVNQIHNQLVYWQQALQPLLNHEFD